MCVCRYSFTTPSLQTIFWAFIQTRRRNPHQRPSRLSDGGRTLSEAQVNGPPTVDNEPPRVNNTSGASLREHMLTAAKFTTDPPAASVVTRRVAGITHRPLLYVTVVQSVAMAISGSNWLVLICGEMKRSAKICISVLAEADIYGTDARLQRST